MLKHDLRSLAVGDKRLGQGAAQLPLRSLFFVCLLVIQAGCAPYAAVSGGAFGGGRLAEIKSGVAVVRGLDFKSEVPVEVQSKEEIRRYFERSLEQEYGDEKLRNMALAYAKLGLFPEALDLKKSLLDFYTAQVAAFYDAEAKRLVLPEDLAAGILPGAEEPPGLRTMMGDMVLAHELTHALQDQHFSLENRLRPSSEDDRTLAFHAVAEGDATVAGFAYLFRGTDDKFLALINQTVQDSVRVARSTLTDVPEAIVEELLFQYYGGVSFVSRLLRDKGWSGVNLLYGMPPLSTEQILHPEKFFDLPDPPTGVGLKNLSALFGPDWREIENNVLGELMIQVLFRRFLVEEEAKRIAEGWDGDRFVAFQRNGEAAFVWATVWDSSRDAEEFLRGYQKILEKKYGGSDPLAGAYIEQREQKVIVVEGLERAHMKSQIEKIWQGMELKEEKF